jgi:hypothetical protein
MLLEQTTMSIELTETQQQALDKQAGPLRVVDPRTNETYVLVRSEVYERIRSILENGSETEDAFQAQIESAAAAGWADPEMDVYNELDPRRRP